MRIKRVYIAQFKNLADFTAEFDTKSLSSVLVGRNGTGKSNLLEALILIFRDLDLGERPSFKYEIDYWCRQRFVQINADPNRLKDRVLVAVDGQSVSYKQFVSRDSRDSERYLPNYVFGYYSGPSNRMETHFEQHQDRFYKDLLKGIDKPLRPLLYARPVHSQFALLAFFSEQEQSVLDFLDEHLRIQELDSVLFVMRQPPWRSEEGDPRFWYAKGVVSTLLSLLYANSLAPLRRKERVNLGFREDKTLEHLYLYLPGIKQLMAIADAYDSQQEFFKALESTYISKLISEVRVRVKVRTVDGSLTYRDMSEGEQQLLMVLGLLRFTREDEALFLLDEPDTHLNPAWGMQYIDFLSKIVGSQDTSQIIMSTHNPLVIASLERDQVQIMQRDDDTGKSIAERPERSPRGMGIGALLTSDVYGLRSQLDLYTLNQLDEKRKLAIKAELTKEEKTKLDELNKELEDVDLTSAVRDPLYKPFVEAMAAKEQEAHLQTPILSGEQREQRRQLASQVIQQLLFTEHKGS